MLSCGSVRSFPLISPCVCSNGAAYVTAVVDALGLAVDPLLERLGALATMPEAECVRKRVFCVW